MAIYSEIEIEFTQEVPNNGYSANIIVISNAGTPSQLLRSLFFYVRPQRLQTSEVTFANNPTAIAGEQSCINFIDAITLDMNSIVGLPLNFIITRNQNKVVLRTYSLNISLTRGFSADSSIIMTPSNNVDEGILLPDLPSVNIDDFCIRIIDVTNGNLILQNELAQSTACKLSYDGGDDLFSQTMASKLVFNMLVEDARDAKFLDLFTGNENRFLTQLINIDDTSGVDVEQLIWQGYLLPEQYKEPYKNGLFFVDFTAIDMLSSLKNKTLKEWLYNDYFPVTELLAIILELTGLKQFILINPTLVPNGGNNIWSDITINTAPYYDGKKYDTAYDILNDVLKSLALTLYSYQGFWIIDGFGTKKDTNIAYEQYDYFGKLTGITNCVKKLKKAYLEADSVNLGIAASYSDVNVSFDEKENLNIFSENVVVAKNTPAFVRLDGGDVDLQYGITFRTNFIENWQFNGFLNIDYRGSGFIDKKNFEKIFYQGGTVRYQGAPFVDDYLTYTETNSIANYFLCPERPFVFKDLQYELEISISVSAHDTLYQVIEAGNLAPFSIFLNGVEYASNRPSFPDNQAYSYELKKTSFVYEYYQSAGYTLDGYEYTLKTKIKFNQNGNIEFRLLGPILDYLRNSYIVSFNELKLMKVIENDIEINAVRMTGLNNKIDYDLKISCRNGGFENSIVLNKPDAGRNTNDYLIYLLNWQTILFNSNYQHFKDETAVVNFFYWPISGAFNNEVNFRNIFYKKRNGSVLKRNKLTGFSESLKFNYGDRNSPNELFKGSIGFIDSFTNSPLLPKYYKPSVLVENDEVYYHNVYYPEENQLFRDKWQLKNATIVNENFEQSLARLLHQCYPENLFTLEATALEVLMPNDLLVFKYNNVDRNFISTRLEIDLFAGKTSFFATEAKYQELTDIKFS